LVTHYKQRVYTLTDIAVYIRCITHIIYKEYIYILTDIAVYIRCITQEASFIRKVQMPVILRLFLRRHFGVTLHKTCKRGRTILPKA